MASQGAEILMLHRVRDDVPTAFGLPSCYRLRGTSLTPHELATVLDRAGPFIALAAVEEALEAGRAPPVGRVLTFDDGYREHADLVAPALRARGVPATFYVAAGLHGQGDAVAPVDAWYRLLDHANRPVGAVTLPSGERWSGRVDTLAGKRAWVTGPAKAALLDAPPAAQRAMLAELAASLGCAPPPGLAARLYLSRGEWAALHTGGLRVGAHSVTHPRLTTLPGPALRAEVEGSVAAVAALGGPVAFAFPDGAYDAAVVESVRAAGARSAVTCEPGGLGARSDVLRLPRRNVTPAWARSLGKPRRRGVRAS